MSVYNTGVVSINVGSSSVTGSGTNVDWLTNISAGDLFKIRGENTWYEVAAVTDATNLTLTTRYLNSDYYTARSENIASVGPATNIYSGTRLPVSDGSF